MISSVNAYGGLSSSLLLKLFDTNSASSSSPASASATAANAPASVGADPALAIKSILAVSRIGGENGGWSVTETAEAAYPSQMAGAGSIEASVTVSAPGAVQQINDAVSYANQLGLTKMVTDHSTGLITFSTNSAVNIRINDGAVSATALDGATFSGGLPSLDSIQQALGSLKSADEVSGYNGVQGTDITGAKTTADAWWNNNFSGSFTFIQLPKGAIGRSGGDFTTFSSNGDNSDNWMLVLPHNSISVTASTNQAIG